MYRNNIAYRIIAFALSLLMSLTSISFAVDMHYCQGKLKSYSFFGKAKNCHELAQAKAACPFHAAQAEQATCSVGKKGCCEHKTLYFQLDQDQKTQTNEWAIAPNMQLFLVAYTTVFLAPRVIIVPLQHYFQYKPPLIRLNRSILFQSFLL